MACPSGMTAIAPATAIVLVDRDFRFHVATGAECRLHGMSLRRSLTLAIRAMGNWSPRRARLSTSPGRSATRLAEDSSSLSPRVACGFSLSISHASGAWSSEMKPRGGSPRYAGGGGHMTKGHILARRHFLLVASGNADYVGAHAHTVPSMVSGGFGGCWCRTGGTKRTDLCIRCLFGLRR
jgi:hypothetical protein